MTRNPAPARWNPPAGADAVTQAFPAAVPQSAVPRSAPTVPDLARLADREAATLAAPWLRVTAPLPAAPAAASPPVAVPDAVPAENPPAGPRVLAAAAITGTVLGAVLGMHVILMPAGVAIRLGWYGSAVSVLIGAKLVLSLLARPFTVTPAAQARLDSHQVVAVITCRNEDPAALRLCLDSLITQTRPVNGVAFIDDGSDDPACQVIARNRAPAFEACGIPFRIIAFEENLGKREGLAAGFAAFPEAWAYACVDSDTVLKRTAIGNLVRPMAARDVHAVTGAVGARNRGRNLLTRLIDLRYAYAFLGERAAYSVLGSVLCVCGSLALYRGATARECAGKLTGQRFLGQPCTYGDDRHMTFWCLKKGRVVLEPSAVAWTLVPKGMGHFMRQQNRWSKSFFRESLWMLARMSPARACWWLTLVELGSWLGFTAALLYSLAVHPLLTGHFAPGSYLGSALLLSYARSGHYAGADHPGMSWRERAWTLLLAPVYGLIHITLLLPLRVFALLTLRDNSWGTRKNVEVGA